MNRIDRAGAAYASGVGQGQRQCPRGKAWPQDHQEASPQWGCPCRLSGWRWPGSVLTGSGRFQSCNGRKQQFTGNGVVQRAYCSASINRFRRRSFFNGCSKELTFCQVVVVLENILPTAVFGTLALVLDLRGPCATGLWLPSKYLRCVFRNISSTSCTSQPWLEERHKQHREYRIGSAALFPLPCCLQLIVGVQKSTEQEVAVSPIFEVLTSHMTTCRLKTSERAEAFLCALTSGAIQNCDEIFKREDNQADRKQKDMCTCKFPQKGGKINTSLLVVSFFSVNSSCSRQS